MKQPAPLKSKRITFPPLENGLDYLRSVVERLAGTPTARDLKYAVLHLSAAIEVLLKTRLQREHWTLIVDKIDQTTREQFERGDFVSVSAKVAMSRLTEAAGIKFSLRQSSAVSTVTQMRNRLQHHGLDETVEAVRRQPYAASTFCSPSSTTSSVKATRAFRCSRFSPRSVRRFSA